MTTKKASKPKQYEQKAKGCCRAIAPDNLSKTFWVVQIYHDDDPERKEPDAILVDGTTKIPIGRLKKADLEELREMLRWQLIKKRDIYALKTNWGDRIKIQCYARAYGQKRDESSDPNIVKIKLPKPFGED